MKISKMMKILFAIVLLLTAAAAVLHLTTRQQVPAHTLAVEYAGKTHTMNFSALPLQQVCGTQVTGKGEVREIDATGCTLQVVLEHALGMSFDASEVTVIAGDGFSAQVTAAEWQQAEQVYLILREDETLQLLVLGDSDSKRNVKNVERLLVE